MIYFCLKVGSHSNVTSCVPFVTQLQGDWEHHPDNLPPGLNSGCEPSEGPQAGFSVDASQKWASFNFISAAGIKALVASIDEHPLYIYEVDGRYIEPQLAHSIEIYNGERYSAMVKLDKEPASYTMRVASTGAQQVISGYGTVTYQGGEINQRESEAYINYGGAPVLDSVKPLDTSNLPPFPPIHPAQRADDFHLLTLGRISSSWQWTLDGTELFPADLDALYPIIRDPDSPQLADALKITTINGTWVDLVYQLEIDEPTVVQPPHPMHKHSNKAFIIGRGTGKFQWSDVNEAAQQHPEIFSLNNPLYRDTFVTSPAGESWLAIRYQVVNPGPFFLHCHTLTHLHGGMGMVLLDGIDAWPDVPESYL